jgi:hypothetical protein
MPYDESFVCSHCGDAVPRDHTVVVAEGGRVCWFCYSSMEASEDDTGPDEMWDDDDGDLWGDDE